MLYSTHWLGISCCSLMVVSITVALRFTAAAVSDRWRYVTHIKTHLYLICSILITHSWATFCVEEVFAG